MDFKEIMEFQRNFDVKHGWDWRNKENQLELLKYVSIALTGEVGEFSNIIKKALREKFPEGKLPDDEQMKKLKDELADIFIYTLVASQVLEMDLEKEYFEKMKLNVERFKKFEE